MDKRGICFTGETNTPSREERRPSAFPNNKDPSNLPLRGIWPREDGKKNSLIKGFSQIPNCKKNRKKIYKGVSGAAECAFLATFRRDLKVVNMWREGCGEADEPSTSVY